VEERALATMFLGIEISLGFLVNNNCAPSPCFFVSVASKGFSFSVNPLESTLVDARVSVASKELR
jgi:hypothetical protein